VSRGAPSGTSGLASAPSGSGCLAVRMS
jgi:hypothetical protein